MSATDRFFHSLGICSTMFEDEEPYLQFNEKTVAHIKRYLEERQGGTLSIEEEFKKEMRRITDEVM